MTSMNVQGRHDAQADVARSRPEADTLSRLHNDDAVVGMLAKGGNIENGTERPSRNPKIAFVCPKIYPLLKFHDKANFAGGAELQQLLLGRELAARGYAVSYITLDNGQGPVEDFDGLKAFSTYRPKQGIPGLRYFYPRLRGTLKAIRAANADIYYVRCADHSLAQVVWQCRRMGKKVVFCGANDPDFDFRGLRHRLSFRDRHLYQWGLRRCDAIVVQNHVQQDLLRDNFGRKATLIHNGLPVVDEACASGDDILWIARWKEFKQPNLFIDLARRLPDERFVMIGGLSRSTASERANYTELEQQAKKLPNLEFLGFQPMAAVEQRLSQAKLLVNTSRHEGFPNTFLQAWRRGIPVLSFVDPDNLIQQHRLGWSVNDLDEMENVIRSIPSGAETSRSTEIRAVFRRCLTIDTAVCLYEQLFASLLNSEAKKKSTSIGEHQ